MIRAPRRAAGEHAGRRRLAPLPPAPVLIALAGALGACLAMRLVMVLSPIGRLDADEAVTAIMAERILDGDLYAFYAGQNYLGTAEQYLQAAVFAVAPDTATSLRVVQVVLAVLACGLVYGLATRVTASRWGGVLAAALFAVGPYYNVFKGSRSHGAYAIAAVLVAAIAILALRVDPRSRRAPAVAAAFGLCCGLALWQSTLTAYVVIPAVLWALASARGHLRSLVPIGIGGAVVGAAPFIAHRLAHGLFVGTGRPPQFPSTYAERMDNLVQPVSEMFLGVKAIGGVPVADWAPPAWALLVAVAALAAAAWVRRRGLWALVTLRRDGRRPIDLVLASFLVAPLLYGLSDFTWYAGEPRYLFTLYPSLAVAAAALVLRTPRRVAPAVGVALIGVTLALSAIQIDDAIAGDGYPPVIDGGLVLEEDLPDVARALEREGVDAVYANYWLAYPLQFAAGEALAVSPYGDQRFPALDAAVATSPEPPAYVTPLGEGAAQVRRGLRALGTTFDERRVESVVVFSDLSQPRTPAEVLPAGAAAPAAP
jgi:hypothetical protein